MKATEAKRERDQILREVKAKQQKDADYRNAEERARGTKLAIELEQEKLKKLASKQKVREAAMKVIKDNMQEKKNRMVEHEMSKKHEAEQVKVNMKMALEKEQMREKETQARSDKIQALMENMADVVKDDGKELQLK